jgi:hypothetical protein
MNLLPSHHTVLSLALASSLLVACSSGVNDAPVAVIDPPIGGTDVPTSATTSSAGAIAFAKATVASSRDTAEPIVVGDAVLATSDTDEPDPSV